MIYPVCNQQVELIYANGHITTNMYQIISNLTEIRLDVYE